MESVGETIKQPLPDEKSADSNETVASWNEALKIAGLKNKVNLRFIFSAHQTAEDRAGFAEQIADTDIIILEMAGWTQKTLELFNAVSGGTTTPDQALAEMKIKKETDPFYDARLKELSDLYGSNKVLLFLDIPKNHQLLEKYFISLTRCEKALKNGESFREVLNKVKVLVQNGIDLNVKREEYILNSLKTDIPKFISENNDFAKKDKINVLVSMGTGHTGIYHKLKREGAGNISRVFGKLPYSFSLLAEIFRKANFGKEITEEDLIRLALEIRISLLKVPDSIEWLTNDTRRKAINSFTLEEIRDILENDDQKRIWEVVAELQKK